MDVNKSLEEILKSIHFWQQYLRSYTSKEKISQDYSIILIGNKKEKVSKEKVNELSCYFKEFQELGKISRFCFTSGLIH